MNPRLVDLLIRAGAIHTMSGDPTPLRSIAIRGDTIIAVSARSDGLDDILAADTRVRGHGKTVVDLELMRAHGSLESMPPLSF
jgi:predicted amidohydrolase YtcJ